MTSAVAIETRRPTGRPAWPLFLVEGPEKAGKTHMAAQLATTGRFSRSFWIDWGEGSADEYGALPGADYEVVMHDGTFSSVANQIHAIREYAQQQENAGEAPVLLIIDSMTAEWDTLKADANTIAVQSPSGQKKLAKDPGADVSIPMNVWNTVGERHGRLMRLLMTFPGVVVMTARGKNVTSLDANGRPVEGSTTYKVEGHKNLAYDASAVVRLSREAPPVVVGMRSVHHGIRPGVDKPVSLGQRGLEYLAWDVILKDASPEPRQVDGTTRTEADTSGQQRPALRAVETGPEQTQDEPEQEPAEDTAAEPEQDETDWDEAVKVAEGSDDWAALIEAARQDSDVLGRIGQAVKTHRPDDVPLREWIAVVWRHEAARGREGGRALTAEEQGAEDEARQDWQHANAAAAEE